MLTPLQTCFFVSLNRNTILMSKKLELYLCTLLSFFLDCVCQRNENSGSIAPSSIVYPCFCIPYTALHASDRPRQASKLICPGNMRFLILLGHNLHAFTTETEIHFICVAFQHLKAAIRDVFLQKQIKKNFSMCNFEFKYTFMPI